MVFDLAKRSPVFRAKKTGSCRFVNSGRYPSEKKSSNRRVERVVSRQIEEKKDEKKEAYFVPKYRRKTICARNIRGFLFIRKNSCSRLRFGNSFRYSKQKKRRKNFVKSKKIRKKYQFSAPPVYETSCFRSPCFTLRVFIKLMVGRLSS